jgi:hypothetical protein
MDELIRQGQWWWLIAVPVVAGLFALAGAWFGGRLGKYNEHSQWRRNERVEAYTDFLSAITEEQYKRWGADHPPLKFPRIQLAKIEIVGSQKVRALARKFQVPLMMIHMYTPAVSRHVGAFESLGEEDQERVRLYAEYSLQLDQLRVDFLHAVRKDLGTYGRDDNDKPGIEVRVELRDQSS